MLAIVNVTKDDTQELHDYEIRINRRVIGKFKHKQVPNGAAQCLRDAAEARKVEIKHNDLSNNCDKYIRQTKDT